MYKLVQADFPPQPESQEFAEIFRQFGKRLAPKYDSIYLIHGTFVGGDALGWNEQLSRRWPNAASKLTELGKLIVDKASGQSGNFTAEYARFFHDSIAEHSGHELDVRLFHWSGENTHAARCRAAIKFLANLLTHRAVLHVDTIRPLVFCHSHAGNVLALVSNLLAAPDETRNEFLRLVEPTFSHETAEQEIFSRVSSVLREATVREVISLDIVTLGTPIRYGWDTGGFDQLLHFVHHHPRAGKPEYLATIPKLGTELVTLAHGDFIQQLGIATTNFMPFLFDRKLVKAENRLGEFLQGNIDHSDFLERLRLGMRVPHDGTTLLVAYDDNHGLARKIAGHAIYTRPEWLSFHVRETTNEFAAENQK